MMKLVSAAFLLFTATAVAFSSNTANNASVMKGCKLERVASSKSLFTITIDGEEADLGNFTTVIYKKILSDAKQQRFVGFRPGTVPPHLLSTYKMFAMDEAAREATCEAMEQNNIKAFEDARTEFEFDSISIAPPQKKNKNKKKKGGRKNKKKEEASTTDAEDVSCEEVPARLQFNTMKEAVDAGWEPGQCFSFVAKNVRGTALNEDSISVQGEKEDSSMEVNAQDILANIQSRRSFEG